MLWDKTCCLPVFSDHYCYQTIKKEKVHLWQTPLWKTCLPQPRTHMQHRLPGLPYLWWVFWHCRSPPWYTLKRQCYFIKKKAPLKVFPLLYSIRSFVFKMWIWIKLMTVAVVHILSSKANIYYSFLPGYSIFPTLGHLRKQRSLSCLSFWIWGIRCLGSVTCFNPLGGPLWLPKNKTCWWQHPFWVWLCRTDNFSLIFLSTAHQVHLSLMIWWYDTLLFN